MGSVKIPYRQTKTDAEEPRYAYVGDAGMDLHSAQEITLRPFERAMIPTGIALAIPEGYAGFVLPRSGMAIKHGLSLVNTPGLIDSNYRGEVNVLAINLDPANEIIIKEKDRIAQLVIMRIEEAELVLQADLSTTDRGSKGFGSSGC